MTTKYRNARRRPEPDPDLARRRGRCARRTCISLSCSRDRALKVWRGGSECGRQAICRPLVFCATPVDGHDRNRLDFAAGASVIGGSSRSETAPPMSSPHVLRRPGSARHSRPRAARRELCSAAAHRKPAGSACIGGQVIGQALVAAVRTVDASRPPHSMHAYFLLPGDPKVPIIYDVDRIRDGRSFTTRRVTARQHGHPIFSMQVSFHANEPGLDHQAKMPDVPPPEQLPSESEMRKKYAADHARSGAALLRARAADRIAAGRIRPLRRQEISRRPLSHLDQAPPGNCRTISAIHQCVLAYASDMTLLDAALAPHGRTLFEREFMAASLDHALWLHRPFRADDWLLYAQDSPNLHGSRGFARGLIFTRDGTLVASVAQEGLVRERRETNA